jgi:hypothetical protein
VEIAPAGLRAGVRTRQAAASGEHMSDEARPHSQAILRWSLRVV